MRKILLWAMVILVVGAGVPISAGAETEEKSVLPSTIQAQILLDLLNNATVEQRTRASRWLTNKYKLLGTEMLALVDEDSPEFLATIMPHLRHLVKTKYQRLPNIIHSQLSQTPAVQNAVVEMIRENYPDLITDLQAVPEGEDLQQRTAQLIQEKYPTLLGDVLATINEKFPTVLQDLQHQVIAAFPGLLADVARFMARNYPDLAGKIFTMIINKYPQLLPELLVILTQPPPVAAAESDATVAQPATPAPTTP